jgi:hypothetical protein
MQYELRHGGLSMTQRVSRAPGVHPEHSVCSCGAVYEDRLEEDQRRYLVLLILHLARWITGLGCICLEHSHPGHI